MAGDAAGQQQKMRDFVSRLFQGSPDLSILTHAIIRKKYLDHVGLENLSKQEKEQLKQLVEEELVQMKVDQLPSNVELRTETQDSFKSGDRKRPLHISHSLEDEIKNEQGQKRQKIEKTLEVSSDEKDSGIDSKKRPRHRSPKLLRMFSDSSDQGDSRAGNHSAESESDEETTKSKRKSSLQEARGRGRKSTKGQGIRGSQKREVSESEETTTDTGQSDLEEEVKEHRKVTKGNSLKQRDFKKKVDKGSKATDPKSKAKNRMMNKQREERSLSEGGTDLSAVEEISEKKREWSESESEEKKSFSTNKAQQRMGPGTQKGSKGNESEDASGSGPDQKCNLQKKMADSQCRRKGRVIEDSGSSSEDSAGQSPVRKEGAKRARGERGSQQTGNHSKPKRQPKKRGGRKKLQREDLCRKKPEEVKKMMQRIQESTSEESESESEEHKSLEEEKKWVQDPTSSEGESQSKTNQGQLRKAALISHPSKSESDESEDGDPRRTLKKESKHVSGCDSSQGEKSQRESIGKEISVLGSEDLGSKFGGKKKIQSQQQRTKKLQRRSATKEKQGEESSQEEGSTSEEDEPTTSQQHHLGKDKKHHSGKKEEHPSIQRLKRYIRECGVRQNYKKLLAGCHSRKAQIEVLKEELGSLGIKEVSSDEKDSGIDSKKRPHHGNPNLLRMFSDSSDQGETRAGNHSDESESDEETIKSKRKPSLQEARRERRRGRKSSKSQRISGSQKRGVRESEETNMGQSDLEEEVKEHRKVTKGNSLKQRDFKKKADKKSKANDPKGKAKNRTMNKQREERNLSEGGTDLLEVEEISEKKSEWSESEEKKSFSTNKSQERMGPGTQKDSKGNESEDASGSGPDKIFYLQKKMADTQCRRKCRVIEDSGSSSEDSAGQSPMRKEGAKRARGERGSQQTGNHYKPKRQPKERGGRKKLQREDLGRKKPEEVKKMTQRIQETTSEESESESGEHKSAEAEKKCVQDSTSSEGEPQSETNQNQPRKAALISHPSESESDESEDGDPRALGKESKHVSGSDSSQGEEKLKKRAAQKSQRKSIGKEISVLGSEDLGSEFKGKKKVQIQQQRRTKKLQRRSATKEKQEEESSQEEVSSSEEDEPTTSQQHHLGKDKKHHSGKKEEHPSVQRLKRYIRECGVHRNYIKLLAGCHSRKAQIVVLKEELESLGIKGTPSLAKCKALKQKREEAAEVASLDINNIIATEGRPKRRKVWSLYNKPLESPSSPEEPIVRRHTTDWSQLRGVISSDGESG